MFIDSSQHPSNFWVVPVIFNSIFCCLKNLPGHHLLKSFECIFLNVLHCESYIKTF